MEEVEINERRPLVKRRRIMEIIAKRAATNPRKRLLERKRPARTALRGERCVKS